jgi:hypothetical protein
VKNKRSKKIFLCCWIANARSVVSNQHIFNYHLAVTSLDWYAIIETWLKVDYGKVILLNVCPAGYSPIHCFPRTSGRGDGVAPLFCDLICVKHRKVDFSPTSFE